MPEVGSSRNTTLGLPRKAMATLSFLLCPPESSSALVLPFSWRPAPHKALLYGCWKAATMVTCLMRRGTRPTLKYAYNSTEA